MPAFSTAWPRFFTWSAESSESSIKVTTIRAPQCCMQAISVARSLLHDPLMAQGSTFPGQIDIPRPGKPSGVAICSGEVLLVCKIDIFSPCCKSIPHGLKLLTIKKIKLCYASKYCACISATLCATLARNHSGERTSAALPKLSTHDKNSGTLCPCTCSVSEPSS